MSESLITNIITKQSIQQEFTTDNNNHTTLKAVAPIFVGVEGLQKSFNNLLSLTKDNLPKSLETTVQNTVKDIETLKGALNIIRSIQIEEILDDETRKYKDYSKYLDLIEETRDKLFAELDTLSKTVSDETSSGEFRQKYIQNVLKNINDSLSSSRIVDLRLSLAKVISEANANLHVVGNSVMDIIKDFKNESLVNRYIATQLKSDSTSLDYTPTEEDKNNYTTVLNTAIDKMLNSAPEQNLNIFDKINDEAQKYVNNKALTDRTTQHIQEYFFEMLNTDFRLNQKTTNQDDTINNFNIIAKNLAELINSGILHHNKTILTEAEATLQTLRRSVSQITNTLSSQHLKTLSDSGEKNQEQIKDLDNIRNYVNERIVHLIELFAQQNTQIAEYIIRRYTKRLKSLYENEEIDGNKLYVFDLISPQYLKTPNSDIAQKLQTQFFVTDEDRHFHFLRNGITNQDFAEKNRQVIKVTQASNFKLQTYFNEFQNNRNNPVYSQFALGHLIPIAENLAKAHLNVLKDVSSRNKFLTNADITAKQEIAQSAKDALALVSQIASASKVLNKNIAQTAELEEYKKQLTQEIQRIETTQDSYSSLGKTIGNILQEAKNTTRYFKTLFGLLGIEAVLAPAAMFSTVRSRSVENGNMRYSISMTDASMGLHHSDALNNDLSYTQAQQWYSLTQGHIPFTAIANLYTTLFGNIGGQYGHSLYQARNDMYYFANNLIADKELYQIAPEQLRQFLKIYYKDMNESASTTINKLRALEMYASSSQIPVSKLLNAVNSMAEEQRRVGVNSDHLMNTITSLAGWHGMRLENAVALQSQTASSINTMSHDMGRTLVAAMLRGETGNPFTIMTQAMMRYDRFGKPIDKNYNIMVDRLFTETSFQAGRWGINTPQGMYSAITQLRMQGYSMQEASQIAQLMKLGDRKKLIEKLKGFDALKQPDAPAVMTKKFAHQLSESSKQLSIFGKYLSDYMTAMNNIAGLIHNRFSGRLNNFINWLTPVINKYEKSMEAVIGGIGGFLTSPTMTNALQHFSHHPFLDTAGIFTAYGLGKYAIKQGARKAIRFITKNKNTAETILKEERGIARLDPAVKVGATVAIGALIAKQITNLQNQNQQYYTNTMVTEQEQVSPSNDNYWLHKTTALINSGTAPIHIVESDENNAPVSTGSDFISLLTRASSLGIPLIAIRYYAKKEIKKRTKKIQEKINEGNKKYKIAREHELKSKVRQIEKQLHTKIKRMNKLVRKNKKYAKQINEEYIPKARTQAAREIIEVRRQTRENIKAHEKARNERFETIERTRIRPFKYAKGLATNIGIMALFDIVTNPTSKDLDKRLAVDTISTSLGYATDLGVRFVGSKFGLRGRAAGAIATLGDVYVTTKSNELLSNYFGIGSTQPKANAATPSSALNEENQDSIVKLIADSKGFKSYAIMMQTTCRELGISNATYIQAQKESLSQHGIVFSQCSEFEKALWAEKFKEFLAIYGDWYKALNAASNVVANMRNEMNNISQNGNYNFMLNANGQVSEATRQQIYDKMGKQFDSDDNVKGAYWESKMNNTDDINKKLKYEFLANGYYHNNDAVESQQGNYWYDLAYQIQHETDETKRQFYQNALNKLRQYDMLRGDMSDSTDVENISPTDVKKMWNYMAGSNYEAAKEDYERIEGEKEIQKDLEKTSQAGNIAANDTGDYMAGGNNGWDMTYIRKYESSPGATDLKDVNPKVIAAMNAIAKEYHAETGGVITITAGAEYGYHSGDAQARAGQHGYHASGDKIDVSSEVNGSVLARLVAQHGGAIGNEGNHYDLNFYNNYVGGTTLATPTKYLISQKDGTGRMNGINKNNLPIGVVDGKIQTFEKPQTLKSQLESSRQAYSNILNSLGVSGQQVTGKLIDNSWVESSQNDTPTISDNIKAIYEKYNLYEKNDNTPEQQSAEANEIPETKTRQASIRKTQQQAINASLYAGGTTLTDNLKALNNKTNDIFQREENSPSIQKNRNPSYPKVLEAVQKVAKEFLLEPMISCDVKIQ